GPVLFKAALRADGSVGPFSQLTNVPDFCGPQCNFDTAIALDPANTNVIYAGGSKNFRGDVLIVSTDGGSTWSPDLYAGNGACTSTDPSGQCVNANGQLHTDTHAIAVSPDGKVLLVGTDKEDLAIRRDRYGVCVRVELAIGVNALSAGVGARACTVPSVEIR